MRRLLAILALTLAACASSDDDRFQVGAAPRAFVIIGVAEAFNNTDAEYRLLWRRLDSTGAFAPYDGDTIFEPETNARGATRIPGTPGEFTLREIDPGVYALDSVFAVIQADRVNYTASGVITGPDRPAFEVRPGEAIYLGIWQVDLEDVRAVARPWRLDDADLRAVLRERDDAVRGQVALRETTTRAVACAPHRLTNISQRQVC